MRKQLLLVALLCTAFGTSIGYFAALGSSAKKTIDAVASLPSAIERMDDFSNHDIAIIIRMFKASVAGKPSHTDKAVARRLAEYHSQRSVLSDAEQEALGSDVLLSEIEKLRKSSAELKNAFEAATKAEDKK